jgi:hypothetical protein
MQRKAMGFASLYPSYGSRHETVQGKKAGRGWHHHSRAVSSLSLAAVRERLLTDCQFSYNWPSKIRQPSWKFAEIRGNPRSKVGRMVGGNGQEIVAQALCSRS